MDEKPFTQTQYCVFVDREDGAHGIAAGVSFDSALMSAALYYHDMNQHPQNDMDMTEIERFYVRTRQVDYHAMDETRHAAKDVVTKSNPWYKRHWNS